MEFFRESEFSDELTQKFSETAEIVDKNITLKKDIQIIIDVMKEDIKKEEEYLKKLTENHTKALYLLSKCTGTELSFIEKQKNFSISNYQTEIGFGNNYRKRTEKIKIANLKKQKNEEEIETIEREISLIQDEIKSLDVAYKENLEKLKKHKDEIILTKNQLVEKMEEEMEQLLSKNAHRLAVSNSSCWSPIEEQLQNDSSQNYHTFNKDNRNFKDSRESVKNYNFSFHRSPINSSKNINHIKKNKLPIREVFIFKTEGKKLGNNSIPEAYPLESTREQKMEKKETKREIYELFRLIADQEKILSTVFLEKQDILSTKTINKIKNQQKFQISQHINEKELLQELKEGKEFDFEAYSNFLKDEEIHKKISKNLEKNKRGNPKTITTLDAN